MPRSARRLCLVGLLVLAILPAVKVRSQDLQMVYNLGKAPGTSDSPKQRAFGAVAGDGFGKIIRTGDVNGDGRTDLIVGSGAGKVYIWLGNEHANSSLDAVGTAGSPPNVILTGFASLNSMVVGDVNGDGRADIVAGITPEDAGSSHGRAAIVLGRASFPGTLYLNATGAHDSASVLIDAAYASEGLAAEGALMLGDLNGDGKQDIILGAPDSGGVSNSGARCGAAYVFLGRSVFPQVLSVTYSGDSIAVLGAGNDDALTQGGAMHVADLNGDGIQDLILGAPNGEGSRGAAYVIYGREDLASGMFFNLTYAANVKLVGAAAGAALTQGNAIASGDLNGDGIQDLILGAPQAQSHISGRIHAGQAYILYGGAHLSDYFRLGSDSPYDADVTLDGAFAEDGLTSAGALRVADLNGDGIDDLVLASHNGRNTSDGGEQNGQAYVVFGRKSPAALPRYLDMNPGAPGDKADVIIQGAYSQHHLTRGGAIVTGDLDGDGIADLVVGSDRGGASDSLGGGVAYIIPGRTTFPKIVNLRLVGASTGPKSILIPAGNADRLTQGGALAIADLNGDGGSDLIVGAPVADAPNERQGVGAAYVIQGLFRAELVVLSPAGADVATQGTVALGRVAKGSLAVPFTFTVKNTGNAPLEFGYTYLEGGNANMFETLPDGFPLTIPGRGQVKFDVFFTPSSVGVKRTNLVLATSDADEKPFIIRLEADVANGTAPPLVKTLAAEPGNTMAILRAEVNPKGYARRVFFDYGRTSDCGETVEATAVAADAPANTKVQAVVANLLGHTRYYYRVRVVSLEGSALGAKLSFDTKNTLPSANADAYDITDSAVAELAVLSNDSDANGDALSISSFTQAKVGNVTVGKVAKAGNALVFAAPGNFSSVAADGATFTYVIKDALGAVSASATIVVRPVSAVIDTEFTVPAAGGPYNVTVTTQGLWSVNESVPWLTGGPWHEDPASYAEIILTPNNSVDSRDAYITIAGQPHHVIQSGVLKPSIALPETGVPDAVISGGFNLPIVTTNSPVIYEVSSLPPGLTMDKNGVISGSPTRAGTFDITVKAKNAAGAADDVLAFQIIVAALNEGFAGAYLGFINATDTSVFNQGARIELTTTSKGSVSGKVITPAGTRSFTGKLDPDSLTPDSMEMNVPFPTKDGPDTYFHLQFTPGDQTFSGQMWDTAYGAITGWRSGWNAVSNRAAAYRGLHTFTLKAGSAEGIPDGYGYGSFTVNEGTGALTISGKLPDNSTFATTGFIGQQGQVLIYQPLYAKKGLLAGVIAVTAGAAAADNDISPFSSFEPMWSKPESAPSARDTVYAAGFYPTQLSAFGGAYPLPAAGGVVMGLENADANARAVFASGGLPSETYYGLHLRNLGTGLTQKVTPIPPVANRFTLSVLNATTGAFSGDFTLLGEPAAKTRKVSYQGQIVRAAGETKGYGFFLLPEFPDAAGETVANTPKWSGSVILEAGQAP